MCRKKELPVFFSLISQWKYGLIWCMFGFLEVSVWSARAVSIAWNSNFTALLSCFQCPIRVIFLSEIFPVRERSGFGLIRGFFYISDVEEGSVCLLTQNRMHENRTFGSVILLWFPIPDYLLSEIVPVMDCNCLGLTRGVYCISVMKKVRLVCLRNIGCSKFELCGSFILPLMSNPFYLIFWKKSC